MRKRRRKKKTFALKNIQKHSKQTKTSTKIIKKKNGKKARQNTNKQTKTQVCLFFLCQKEYLSSQ